MTGSELERLRKEIADVTFEIIDLCSKRIKLARKIAAVKLEKGISIEDLEVERKLRRQALEICLREGVNEDFCNRLLDLLISESKRVQEVIMAGSLRRSRMEGGH